jgi:hypothetical protein
MDTLEGMARRPFSPPLTVGIVVGVLSLTACTSPAEPAAETPTSAVSASPTATATPAAEVTPTAEPEAAPIRYTSCEEIITPAFAEVVASNGWVGWNMVGQEIGHSPFDIFPDGAPNGQLSCRFGKGPEVATDNVLDLAWAPIDEATARTAQQALADAGYQRIEAADGVQYALRADGGWADEEGWGATYLFTGTDVRWAVVRDELPYLAPVA